MYQFFIENDQIMGNTIQITGTDYNHIRNVLRMKPGERIRVSTEDGKSYYAHLTGYEESTALAKIEEEDLRGTELPVRVTLFQGLPKGDKMESIIQKSVELGVAEVVPVSMKHCVVKLDERKVETRVRRWQAIAESAAKQSKRTVIPQVHAPVSWKEALVLTKKLDILLVPYENEQGMEGTREAIRSITPGQTVGILIGPEGGFAPEEIEEAVPMVIPELALEKGETEAPKNKVVGELENTDKTVSLKNDIADIRKQTQVHRISLGRRILRTETAGPATLSMLIYELEE